MGLNRTKTAWERNEGHCRSCGAPIYWTVTEKGKRMPVDRPAFAGNDGAGIFYVYEASEDTLRAVSTRSSTSVAGTDYDTFQSHYATCPDTKTWSKR